MGNNVGQNNIQQAWQAQDIISSGTGGETTPYIPALHKDQAPDSFKKENIEGKEAEKKSFKEKAKKNAIAALPTAGGMAFAWGAGYGLQKLVESENCYKNTPIMRFSKWLDNSFIIKNPISKGIGGILDWTGGFIKGGHKSLKKNSLSYKTFQDGVIPNHSMKELLDSISPENDKALKVAKNFERIDKKVAERLETLAKQPGVPGNKDKIYELVADNYKKLPPAPTNPILKVLDRCGLYRRVKLADKALDVLQKEATPLMTLIQSENQAVAKELGRLASVTQNNQTAGKVAAELRKLSPGFLKKNGLTELVNKVSIATGATKTSRLSKLISDKAIGVGNFLKNGGTMGAFMVLVNGWFLGNSVKEAVEAPKGEKMSTFAEEMLGNWIGTFAAWPLIEKGINGLANLKTIKNPASITSKLAKGIGHVVGFGMPGKGTNVSMFKRVPGMLLRFTILIAGAALAAWPFKKVSHAIFGKPHHKYKKEEEKQKSQVQQAVASPVVMNQAVQNTVDNAQNAGNDLSFQGIKKKSLK